MVYTRYSPRAVISLALALGSRVPSPPTTRVYIFFSHNHVPRFLRAARCVRFYARRMCMCMCVCSCVCVYPVFYGFPSPASPRRALAHKRARTTVAFSFPLAGRTVAHGQDSTARPSETRHDEEKLLSRGRKTIFFVAP